MRKHRIVTEANIGKAARSLQILHTGRYGYHPLCVAPSRLRAPINRFTPRALTHGVSADHRRLRALRALAQQAGYEGVEIMGSEAT